MRFAKYHGLGNDFLVVDLRTTSTADAARAQDPATVVALCDRNFGVGGDGVLAILPSTTADARTSATACGCWVWGWRAACATVWGCCPADSGRR